MTFQWLHCIWYNRKLVISDGCYTEVLLQSDFKHVYDLGGLEEATALPNSRNLMGEIGTCVFICVKFQKIHL